MKTCKHCKFCIETDYGYSNYTVEGTVSDCLLDANPAMPVDRGWGTAPELAFAETCPSFSEGYPVVIDVDRVSGALENYSDDPWVKSLLMARATKLGE